MRVGRRDKVDLRTGQLTVLADLAQYEAEYNPDGTDLISNPYSFVIKGNYAYVVDGGGNTIYKVALDGSGIKQVVAATSDPDATTIPSDSALPPSGSISPDNLPPGYTLASNGIPISNQSVPTNITLAPDGSLTLTEYTYYPFPEGKARIWKIDPDTLKLQQIATGFTQLTGAAYDQYGNLYVLQHMDKPEWNALAPSGDVIGDDSGSVIKIAPDGTRTTLLSGHGLEAASNITVGPDGNLYISNHTRFSQGQVIKIDLRKVGFQKVLQTKRKSPTTLLPYLFMPQYQLPLGRVKHWLHYR